MKATGALTLAILSLASAPAFAEPWQSDGQPPSGFARLGAGRDYTYNVRAKEKAIDVIRKASLRSGTGLNEFAISFGQEVAANLERLEFAVPVSAEFQSYCRPSEAYSHSPAHPDWLLICTPPGDPSRAIEVARHAQWMMHEGARITLGTTKLTPPKGSARCLATHFELVFFINAFSKQSVPSIANRERNASDCDLSQYQDVTDNSRLFSRERSSMPSWGEILAGGAAQIGSAYANRKSQEAAASRQQGFQAPSSYPQAAYGRPSYAGANASVQTPSRTTTESSGTNLTCGGYPLEARGAHPPGRVCRCTTSAKSSYPGWWAVVPGNEGAGVVACGPPLDGGAAVAITAHDEDRAEMARVNAFNVEQQRQREAQAAAERERAMQQQIADQQARILRLRQEQQRQQQQQRRQQGQRPGGQGVTGSGQASSGLPTYSPSQCFSDRTAMDGDVSVIYLKNLCSHRVYWDVCVNKANAAWNNHYPGHTDPGGQSSIRMWQPGEETSATYLYNVSFDGSQRQPSC